MSRNKATQARWSTQVRARAGWVCEWCGSEDAVQAHHRPDGTGVSLCRRCHAWQHMHLANLILASPTRPWPNQTANALARELGVHNRTIIRRARRLKIPFGKPICETDIERIRRTRKGMAVETRGQERKCRWCGYSFYPRIDFPLLCPDRKNCGKPYPLGFPPEDDSKKAGDQ